MRLIMDQPKEHWHLDKRVNVGHLLTTIIIAGSMFIWASNMESRIATISADVENLKDNQAIQTESLRREISYLRGSVDKLNDKLDRLIERK